jgi:hypothetical protein
VSHDRDRSKQLDEEIKLCIANHGPISGYCVIKCTQAPKNTVLYKLKRLVELGELDCKEARKGKVYSLPKTVADLPDGRKEKAPKMVSRGPQKARESSIEVDSVPPKLYSSGRQRHGKSMAAMAFEGNGKRKGPLGGESQ